MASRIGKRRNPNLIAHAEVPFHQLQQQLPQDLATRHPRHHQEVTG
jgi:hypothetical protein